LVAFPSRLQRSSTSARQRVRVSTAWHHCLLAGHCTKIAAPMPPRHVSIAKYYEGSYPEVLRDTLVAAWLRMRTGCSASSLSCKNPVRARLRHGGRGKCVECSPVLAGGCATLWLDARTIDVSCWRHRLTRCSPPAIDEGLGAASGNWRWGFWAVSFNAVEWNVCGSARDGGAAR